MAGSRSLMRSLGQFFGHIAKGVKTPPPEKSVERTVIREETREAVTDAPEEVGGGKVTLRRTTIEEIEVRRDTDG